MSQSEDILNHLKNGGTVTPKEASLWWGCLRLAARIAELRSSGYQIETELITTKRPGRNPVTYARYYMPKSVRGAA